MQIARHLIAAVAEYAVYAGLLVAVMAFAGRAAIGV